MAIMSNKDIFKRKHLHWDTQNAHESLKIDLYGSTINCMPHGLAYFYITDKIQCLLFSFNINCT